MKTELSHGKKENIRVKAQIFDALFSLLDEKNFSDITVTDIIKRAKVARSSYYRNFDSKEEIIEAYMDIAYEKLVVSQTEFLNIDFFDYNVMVAGFNRSLVFFLANGSRILLLYKKGFGSQIQEIFNRYIEDFVGDMPRDSIDRFKLYFISGAVFNVLIQWLSNGAVESPADLAEIIAGYVVNGLV